MILTMLMMTMKIVAILMDKMTTRDFLQGNQYWKFINKDMKVREQRQTVLHYMKLD